MPDRLIVAPDPGAPGFFYAECLATGRRLSGLTEPKVRRSEWFAKFPDQASLSLSEDGPRLTLVEHPVTKSDLPVERRADHATCLEPGCLRPAPLYCSEHRYQMEGASY